MSTVPTATGLITRPHSRLAAADAKPPELPDLKTGIDELLEPYRWMDGLTVDILRNSIFPKIVKIESCRHIVAANNNTWVEFFFSKLERELGFIRNPGNDSNIDLANTVAIAATKKTKELFLTQEIGDTRSTTHLSNNLPQLIKALKVLNLCVDKLFINPPYNENHDIQQFCKDFDTITDLAMCRINQAAESLAIKRRDAATAAVSNALFRNP